ncbi:MAG: hypothetical protein U9N82_10970 [Thermodesulfobacteriota bacterium]|nr:hypothetical protein [Thermodesulfobacteriota bacterium]
MTIAIGVVSSSCFFPEIHFKACRIFAPLGWTVDISFLLYQKVTIEALPQTDEAPRCLMPDKKFSIALAYNIIIKSQVQNACFSQSLRQAQILIFEIFNIFLWLKLSPSLTLHKIEHFETGSSIIVIFDGLRK